MKIIASAFVICCVYVFPMKVCANQAPLNDMPGLWQDSFKIVSDTSEYMKAVKIEQKAKMKLHLEEMKKNMASLPPEMRAQMEQYPQGDELNEEHLLKMLHADPNIKITPTSMLTKRCVVSEKIEDESVEDDYENDNGNEYGDEDNNEYGDDDEDYGDYDKKSDCVSTITQTSKNHFKSTNVCEGDDPIKTEIDVVVESPKHYTGKGYMTRVANGKSFKLAIETQATWLASDCGDVEPDCE